jgi:hypothetical protein
MLRTNHLDGKRMSICLFRYYRLYMLDLKYNSTSSTQLVKIVLCNAPFYRRLLFVD